MSTVLPASPYKGLAPFADAEVDATLFFGRERDVEIVVANAIATRLTVLYGPSGVGKSSLLAAGVARRLRALPERPVVVLHASWSAEPVAALARAVCEAAGVEPADDLGHAVARACAARGDVYLLLDQVEEYFLYHPAGGPLEDELAVVVAGAPHCNVVLSLRDDALARLDRFKAAIPGILDNYLRLGRLSREAARAAVERPLARWRELGGEPVEIEPALTERVLDEVVAGRIRGSLDGTGRIEHDRGEETVEAPYLQLVLERIWEVERAGGSSLLRLETLDGLGGAAQIVADHLERAMDALTPSQQRVASELLRQLVTPSGAKIAHAVPDLAGYAGVPEPEARGVLEALATSRIVRPGDGGRYEIYHDVLAAPILAWRTRYVHARELVEAHRRNRRLAFVAAVATAGLVVMALVAVFALAQRSNAREEAQAAQARELDAQAVALLPTDPERGLVLARRSAALSPTATAEDVLRKALEASRLRRVVPAGAPVLAAAEVKGAVVVAAADGSVVVVRGGSRRVVRTGSAARSASIAGTRVLMTGLDGRLRLVSGTHTALVPGVTDARAAELSKGGGAAVVRYEGKNGLTAPTVRVVTLPEGRVVVEVDHGSPVTAAALSGGTTLLGTGGGVDHDVRIWRIPSGELMRTLKGHVGAVTSIAFSTRGTLVATAGTDGIGRVWRIADGTPVSVLSGHTNYITDITFSPDGTQVATASLDRSARTWKADTGAALATCLGGSEAATSVAFTASGHELVVGSADGNARVFDTVVQPELPVVVSLDAAVTRLAFADQGQALDAVAGGWAYRIALPDGPAVRVGRAAAPSTAVTGPDGARATIHGKEAELVTAAGTTVDLVGHRARITSVAFSADGTRVVTASADHDARIWDARTGAPLLTLRGHFAIVSDARFSPDGRWVVTAGPGTAGVWSATSGRQLYYLRGHEGKLLAVAISAAAPPRVATGGVDGTIRLWTCTICGHLDALLHLADERLAATGRSAGE